MGGAMSAAKSRAGAFGGGGRTARRHIRVAQEAQDAPPGGAFASHSQEAHSVSHGAIRDREVIGGHSAGMQSTFAAWTRSGGAAAVVP